ncbi:HAD hydrolase-like protein [Sphingopyxis indica]|uniref:HAD hydrolase-like protein n=1 Tax=Sphingopyxis indica TaxID=436663 RepID=UPI0029393431|nr:HAD hydrolase-like protein [Sphingopyxis indica]WOF41654.1 HAD hydrolase-like protein [Sphingopyxis indica]
MSFAAIIFDFDGVIADSEVRANRSLSESLTAIGMPATYEDCLRDYYGHNWQETARRIEARFGRPLPAVRTAEQYSTTVAAG